MHLYFYLVSTFVILLCIAIGFYKNCMTPYGELPSVPITTMLKILLFKKIPRDMTRVSFYFNVFLEILKEFYPGGIAFIWVFRPVLFIFGEKAVKLFMNDEAAVDKPKVYQVFEDVFGKGLITSNGNAWKIHRKMLNPVFGVAMLKDKVPIINKHARILVNELLKAQRDTQDITKYLKFCTVSIICETIIGLDMKERKAEVEQFVTEISESVDKDIERIFNPWMHPKFSRKYLKEVKVVRDFAKKILLEMKEASLFCENKTPQSETEELYCRPRKSFAQRLLELHLKDPSSCSVEYMVDELVTIIAAGYDTTAYALMWCLFLLGHHHDVQDRVYEELQSVATGDVTFEDLSELKYMECAIKETLRLYSTVPLYARQLDKNIELGKYNIPKGTTICFIPLLYHRNPEIYPDPEKFDPERFFGGNSVNRPWIYIPFAEGKRSCIGKKLALMEIKIVLGHVLRHFKFTSLERKEDITLNWNIVLSPLKPLHVRLTQRNVEVQNQE